MNELIIFRNRFRKIIKSKLSRGSRNDRLKVLQSDIRLAYLGKHMPLEVVELIDKVEMQLC